MGQTVGSIYGGLPKGQTVYNKLEMMNIRSMLSKDKVSLKGVEHNKYSKTHIKSILTKNKIKCKITQSAEVKESSNYSINTGKEYVCRFPLSSSCFHASDAVSVVQANTVDTHFLTYSSVFEVYKPTS